MAELNNRPAPVYARVNRLKIAPEEFFAGHPQYKPMPDRPDFFEADRLPSDALAAGLSTCKIPAQPSPAKCLIRSLTNMCSMRARHLAGKLRFSRNK